MPIYVLTITSSGIFFMKIAFFRYTLADRAGALLKFIFSDGLSGYADCHPWPALGDFPIEKQLSLLAEGNVTYLTHACQLHARMDADARGRKEHLLSNLMIPKSHFLITNILECSPEQLSDVFLQGFSHVKIKMGKNLEAETEILLGLFKESPLKIRLDFNERLSQESFDLFCERIASLQKQIEFIEDPFPFEKRAWSAIQAKGWTLACDRQIEKAIGHPVAAKYMIWKPAISLMPQTKDQKVIVTSYLGHPLDQVVSAYYAAHLEDKEGVHGLLYVQKELNSKGPCFSIPHGTGWGFDEYLGGLEWELL